MAVAVGSSTSLGLANRTNSTLTAPADIADGNVLLAIVIAGDGGDETAPTVTPPTGFTAVTGSPLEISKSDPYAIAINCFSKVASGESGNYTFTHGASDSEGFMYRITGADNTTPINPNPTTNTGSGTTSTGLSITPEVDESLVVMIDLMWDDAATMSPPTGTTPTFTERYDPGSGGVLWIGDGVLATAGATGNKSHTNGNNTAQPWATLMVCVQAAAAAGDANRVRFPPQMGGMGVGGMLGGNRMS